MTLIELNAELGFSRRCLSMQWPQMSLFSWSNISEVSEVSLLVGLNFPLSVATNLTMSLFLQCGEWAFHLSCLRMWHKMDAYSKSGKYEPPCKWNRKKNKINPNCLEVAHSVLFDSLTLVKEERTIQIPYKLQKHQGNVM